MPTCFADSKRGSVRTFEAVCRHIIVKNRVAMLIILLIKMYVWYVVLYIYIYIYTSEGIEGIYTPWSIYILFLVIDSIVRCG